VQAHGQVSSVSFLPDRLILREELRGTSVEDFATRTVNIATIAFQQLGIAASVAQQFTVRSLIQPKNFRDGRDLLTRRLIAPEVDAWPQFERPLQSLGVRFTFPPTEKDREAFHVRIESWPQDPRSIWIENTGSFAGPIPVDNMPQLAKYLYSTYQFLTGPVGDFLARFDQP
jgi:hypothetical protein